LRVADTTFKLTGDSIAFWKDLYAHPNRDAWWMARNARIGIKDVKPAMLVVGGLFDAEDCFGAWNVYKTIDKQSPATNNRLVMGPWFHGGWERNDGDWLGTAYFGEKQSLYYRQQFELPFFNHFLKDKGDITQIKEVNVFDTGANQWKDFGNWDPKVTDEKALYLQAGGRLSFDGATGGKKDAQYDEYVSDPARPVPLLGFAGDGMPLASAVAAPRPRRFSVFSSSRFTSSPCSSVFSPGLSGFPAWHASSGPGEENCQWIRFIF